MKVVLLGGLVIIISFQELSPVFSTGIDPPLYWVFNYIFAHDHALGQNIIFPHGPFAFFQYPLPENLVVVLTVTIFLRFTLWVGLLILAKPRADKEWLIPFLFAVILLKILNFNLLVVANVSVFYLVYYMTNRKAAKYFSYLLTAFALYVQAYAVVLTSVITLSFWILELVRHKDLKTALIDAGVIVSMILVFWFLMYHSLSGIVFYFIGMKHLVSGNSAAVSYYPDNNWVALIIFLLIFLFIWLLHRTKSAYYFSILFLLAFFAAWKHGMSREDLVHTFILFRLALVLAVFYFLVVDKKRVLSIVLFSIALLSFYSNMKNTDNYSPIKNEFIGINNINSLLTFKQSKSHWNAISLKNISRNILPDTIRQIIGKHPVDVYPWDYSIIPANGFTWSPRPVIQSYAAYNHWLDKRDAVHFASGKAPEFLIWHLNSHRNDNGERLLSIDNRYLLNDEPQTIIELFSEYRLWGKTGRFLLYKKREQKLPVEVDPGEERSGVWNRWLKVPEDVTDLIRVKCEFKRSFYGWIKGFFYKDDMITLCLRTGTGAVFCHRIIPGNAGDGLWVDPFVIDPSGQGVIEHVEAIKFISSNRKTMKNSFTYSFENIRIGKSKVKNKNIVFDFFGISGFSPEDSLLLLQTVTFTGSDVIADTLYWEGFKKKISRLAPNGQYGYPLNEKDFSGSFTADIDSFPGKAFEIVAQCSLSSEYSPGGVLVITVEDDRNNVIYWKGVKPDSQGMVSAEHTEITANAVFSRSSVAGNRIKVYYWNNDHNELWIDRMSVKIFSWPQN